MRGNDVIKVQKKLLNNLIDKYEKSKTFSGDNKVNQSISVTTSKLFHSYMDDSEYDLFVKVNEAIEELEKRNMLYTIREKNKVINKVTLNISQLDESYQLCGRIPKKDINLLIQELWSNITNTRFDDNIRTIVDVYIEEQKIRMEENKLIHYFDGDIVVYTELLQTIVAILKNDKEQFIRDFSVLLFGNSKKLELIEDKIRSFIYEYGDCSSKEDALEEYGIVRTPTNISVKGQGIVLIGTQELDLSKIEGDISFSTISIEQVNKILITGTTVVTVENLTSFHTLKQANSFIIYLGGYHNSIKRKFLMKLYEQNKDKRYFHFGDIDAGGFYIYEHLKKRTGIDFELLAMDIATLNAYKDSWHVLTINDRKRITTLFNKEDSASYQDVLGFMLENNCKLEQEAVKIVL